ncbi:MAG TPA: hemolysin family protein [Bacilli bacterium]|nr:hemolysin family protein [Bacilli bacterium]HPS19081.1 hemolysin family protein [Bacilli bacterium]
MQWYYYLIVGILCLFSAFFSSADIVYGMVDKDRLQRTIDKGVRVRTAKLALKTASRYEFTIASILFGNNIVNILASSIVTLIGVSLAGPANSDMGATIAPIVYTAFMILFCEFLPKAIGKRFNFSLALFYAYPLSFFMYSTFIFVWPISKFFILFGKLFRKKAKEEDVIDEEVLTEMVDTIEESGGLEKEEAELVRSAIDLNDIEAFEIMTPRVDVFSIDVEDDIGEILREGEIFKHSRVPVYQDTIDNIIGILPIKSLLKAYLKGTPIEIRKLCYQPLFIPRNHQVMDLLGEFKTSKVHIAVIKDEYGGTEGIVTMEDILEEIVGDIFDETDPIEEEYIVEEKGKYIVDGAMNIDDFFDLIDFSEDYETDYSTVSGLCQDILDRFAKVGDTYDFFHYTFIVLEADQYIARKIMVIDNDIVEKEKNNRDIIDEKA